ncbi:MAG: N-acetylglucosamine-6-phosphate deacetylase [Succinivibrio sp.]|nr:N-acetylglucosamine-6-phosphate deacetylase [Succinivibrio sp.]
MTATILRNGQWHLASEEFEDAEAIVVQDHRIIPMDPILLEDSEEIDLNGLHVAPGCIDLLANGCNGVNFCNEVSVDSLESMRRWMTAHGTTTFVPTLISSPRESMTRGFASIAEFREKHPGICPGLHLEGPFINSLHKGFHPAGYIHKMGEADLAYVIENKDVISYMTIAPESVKPKYVLELLNNKIKLSLGHSACTYLEAYACLRAGVNNVTHIFNAMRSMVGREPGLIGAVLSNEHVYASVIPDGKHVHPAIIRFLHKMMGNRLYIVSDVQAVAGMQHAPGSFAVGGNEIFVDSKRGLIDTKGALAGTTISLLDGVMFLVERCGYTLDDALEASSSTPAKVLGLREYGRIEPGFMADLVIFDDDFKVNYVIQNGFIKNSMELTL